MPGTATSAAGGATLGSPPVSRNVATNAIVARIVAATTIFAQLFCGVQVGSSRCPWQEVGGASHTAAELYAPAGQSAATAQQSPVPQQ